MNILVTGTDTGVGKTVVTAGLAGVMQSLGYEMGVYKPIQSGAELKNGKLVSPDLEFVRSIDRNIRTKCTYMLKTPCAPSLAAFLESVKIYKNRLKIDYENLRESCDFTIVEGAGGILCPISNDYMVRDLAKQLGLPVLIVARSGLGTINHTLLTIEAARLGGLDVLGVIFSDYPAGTNDISIKTAPEIISNLSSVKVFGCLPSIPELKSHCACPDLPEILLDKVLNNIDIQGIFDIIIPKLSVQPQ